MPTAGERLPGHQTADLARSDDLKREIARQPIQADRRIEGLIIVNPFDREL